VSPFRSPENWWVGTLAFASSYALTIAVRACAAAALPSEVEPDTTPGGKPTKAWPAATPRSPLTTVGPVLVTPPVPASTERSASGAGAGASAGLQDVVV
jgi:hypothetical protein